MVREMRIELTQGILYAPQTYASTSSATRASNCLIIVKQAQIIEDTKRALFKRPNCY